MITTIIISVFVILILAIAFLPTIIIGDIKKRKWRKTIRHQYIDKARIEISNSSLRQRVILWLLSEEGMTTYLFYPPYFEAAYYKRVEKIEEDLINELTKKYTDEYKSRSTKNIKAI